MKKVLFFIMATILFTTGASANHHCGCKHCDCSVSHNMKEKQHKGGFIESSVPLSVQAVTAMDDGAKVMVVGRITQSLGDNKYTFTDGLNDMTVEISHKRWKGLVITPKDKVILKGVLDKDNAMTVLDVKSIKKVQ